MKQLWFKYRKLGLVSIFLISVASAVQIGFEFLKGTLLDVALSKDESKLLTLGIILFGAAMIKAFTHYLYTKKFKGLMVRSLADIRDSIVSSLLRRSHPEYMKSKTGEYLSVYTKQLDTIQWTYFQSIYGLMQIATETIFGLLGLIIIDWRLAIWATLLLMPTVFLPWLMKRWVNSVQESRLKCINEHIGRFSEWVRGVEIIKNYGAEQRFLSLFSRDAKKVEKYGVKFGQISHLSHSISGLLTQLSLIVMIFVSAKFVLSSRITVGMFFVVVQIMEKLQSQVIYISSYTQSLLAAKVAIDNVKKVVEFPVKENEQGDDVDSVSKITFDKIAYSYPNAPERKIINDFNWNIQEKGIYLISGESGSGKSTLMNLLQNYYSVDQGEVNINGIAVDNISNLTDIITIMRQEATFFEDSLRNNLTMYKNIPDAKIFELMNQLGLEKFATPEALDSFVVNGGVSYSGGEARRLSLLRCLLKKSDILILDEPLANVDPLSIDKIVDTIVKLTMRYVFVITHQTTEDLESKCVAHIHLNEFA